MTTLIFRDMSHLTSLNAYPYKVPGTAGNERIQTLRTERNQAVLRRDVSGEKRVTDSGMHMMVAEASPGSSLDR